MSIATGFLTLYNKLGLNTGNFLIHYSWNNSGQIENLSPYYASSYSGILTNQSNHWDNSGSGYLSTGYVEVSGASNIDQTNWTMFFNFKKDYAGESILFSNYQTGLIIDITGGYGFSLVTNSDNNFSFNYYENGETGHSLGAPLSQKNILCATKLDNYISLNVFDFSTEKYNSETFSINNPCVFLSGNRFFLGASPLATTGFAIDKFTGYFDDFIYLNSALSITDITYLTKSFYTIITGSSSASLPPASSGIIGSYGKTGVEYIGNTVSGEFNEVYIQLTNQFKNYSNKIALYDSVKNQFKLDGYYQTGQLCVYLNGQLMTESGKYFSGNACFNKLILSGDYIIDGNFIQSTGYFGQNDVLICDVVTGNRFIYNNFSHISGTGNCLLNGSGWAFFNGLKLISGEDYSISGNNILFDNSKSLYNGATGILYCVPSFSNLSGITGNFTSVSLPNFTINSSMCFVNGIRQLINLDYIEK